MFSKKRVLLCILIPIFCIISVCGVIAGLSFNLTPTVTCPDDGEIFTKHEFHNVLGVDHWEKNLPAFAQTHIESTVSGFGLVSVNFTGTVPGYTGTAAGTGEVGSVGTFLGYPTSRSVHNHPVVGTVMNYFPQTDGIYNWSGDGTISITPWVWVPSSSGFWSWGGTWKKGDKLPVSDDGSGSWTIKTVIH